jgi:carbonic anhydrase
LNGKRYAMVAHLVHRDSAGKLAVVAVLLTPGEASPLIATLWDHLPQAKNEEVALEQINVSDLLPGDSSYYTFSGSLTTPPCTEGVMWFVLRTPAVLSAAQIARFAERYPMNARPVQALNGREVMLRR